MTQIKNDYDKYQRELLKTERTNGQANTSPTTPTVKSQEESQPVSAVAKAATEDEKELAEAAARERSKDSKTQQAIFNGDQNLANKIQEPSIQQQQAHNPETCPWCQNKGAQPAEEQIAKAEPIEIEKPELN